MVYRTIKRKVVCEVSEEPIASVFRLTLSEEDAEETGKEELEVCTGRIYTSDWPKFPQLPVQST